LFVILFFYLGRYVRIAPRLILVGLCCLAAVIAYHVPATNVATRFQDAVSEVTEYFQGDVEEYGSAKARLLTYRAAWHIFQAHPLTGAGPGNYKPLVDQMIARGELPEMTGVHSQPINTFLATLVDCGILGLAALLGVFAAPLWLSIRYIRHNGDLRNIGYALMMLVVAFAHFGLTESIFRRSIHVNFYVVMVAVIMAVAANEKRTDTAPGEDNAPRTVQT
jgi:O-antigen ligase